MLVKCEDLTVTSNAMLKRVETLPTNAKELEEIIILAKNKGAINKDTPASNLTVLAKEMLIAKNFIPETDTFFV